MNVQLKFPNGEVKTIQSYSLPDSQNYPLDLKMLKYFNLNRPGFFVEVGANDGVTQSNTCMLERFFGWRGLLVEPCIENLNKCKISRHPDNIFVYGALVSSNSIQTIKGDFEANSNQVDYASLMNSINGTRKESKNKDIEVPAFTLSDIVHTNNISRIDFMSLDVEGYELEVLKGIDLAADWAPKIFLIELYPNEFKEVCDLLLPYYKLECNLSSYSKQYNPDWTLHNDYLFIRHE
jgi:FkbM family methyltransferase